MKRTIEIVFVCRNCGHEIEILDNEELSNLIGDDCTFCREGCYTQIIIKLDSQLTYQNITVFKGEEKLFEKIE